MPTKSVEVSRERVLAYRFAAHQFDRSAKHVKELRVLSVGIQDSADSAGLIVDARLPDGAGDWDPAVDASLGLAWTLRGSPHLHWRADLDRLGAALWPLSEADAVTRLARTGLEMKKQGISALDSFAESVQVMRKTIGKAMSKAAASTAVTKAAPSIVSSYCRGCDATHVSDLVLRQASLPAGIELEVGTSPPVLRPRPKAHKTHAFGRAAFADLVRAYLQLNGPASASEVAWFLGARRIDVDAHWPDDLAVVSVDGRERWLPAGALATLRRAKTAGPSVRLLAPFDVYMQTSDREFLVPGAAERKALWPVLGRPGTVLVDGEVLGLWRPKKTGKKLAIAVTAFGPLTAKTKALAEDEAARVASVRGATDMTMSWT
ncbi:MAG: DNA glycosylase AlkZ-like family protein [Jatrophihabitans sp.]